MALLVLAQLLLDRLEQLLLQDRRHRNARPLVRRGAAVADRAARLFAAVPLGPRPGQPRADPPLAVAGAALVGWVAKDAPDGAPVPARPAARRGDAPLPESSRHLADAQALAGHPAEDVAHDLGLGRIHLEACLAARQFPADIAVAVRGVRQDADAAAPGRVQLAAPRALQDLGALVLGDDALDLQQQVVLRPLAERAVQ